MSVWVDRLLRDGRVLRGVHFEADDAGLVVGERHADAPPPGAVALDFAVPGLGDAHSHAFHRALRGRTHESGSFWTWRSAMYRAAARLDPDLYREFATAVFREMALGGWTAVGEFHYVHHRPDGTPYPDHAMELALADAAEAAGIRLVLLDTCYPRPIARISARRCRRATCSDPRGSTQSTRTPRAGRPSTTSPCTSRIRRCGSPTASSRSRVARSWASTA